MSHYLYFVVLVYMQLLIWYKYLNFIVPVVYNFEDIFHWVYTSGSLSIAALTNAKELFLGSTIEIFFWPIQAVVDNFSNKKLFISQLIKHISQKWKQIIFATFKSWRKESIFIFSNFGSWSEIWAFFVWCCFFGN